LAAWALLGHPLLAPVFGRPLAQAEVFALAPDPTLIAILAWLLAGATPAAGFRRWVWRAAWGLAGAGCLLAAATLAALGEVQAVVLVAAVGMACGSAGTQQRGS
jgi:hypothetical protein